MHVHSHSNEYQQALGGLFDDTPKAVLAAIAVSALTSGGDRLDAARVRLAREWRALHAAGIVPQKPCKSAVALDDGKDWQED